jgi:hypothetical protein
MHLDRGPERLGRAPGHLSRLLLVTASQISFTAVDQGQWMKGHEAGGFSVLCGLFEPGRGLLENCREDRRTRTGLNGVRHQRQI